MGVICNFCGIGTDNKEMTRVHKGRTVLNGASVEPVDLLRIFRTDIITFALEDQSSRMCSKCLQQLKQCYSFTEQMRATQETLATDRLLPQQDRVGATQYRAILPRPTDSDVSEKKKYIPLKGTSCEGRRLYRCSECPESFVGFRQLKAHEEQQHNSDEFGGIGHMCKYCGTCYGSAEKLEAHMAGRHVEGKYACALCTDKHYKSKGNLLLHVARLHQQQTLHFYCGECEDIQSFTKREHLREHLQSKHQLGTSREQIDDLNKSQSQSGSNLADDDVELEMNEEFLDEFLLSHTNDNSFQFSECWDALDLHLPDVLHLTSGGKYPNNTVAAFQCPRCYEYCVNLKSLLRHLAERHELGTLICRKCNRSFASLTQFKSHRNKACTQSFESFAGYHECPYCSKCFQTDAKLKQHLRIVHTRLKRHVCQLCDKQFSTLDHLKKHVLSQHQNERKHICHVCAKGFTQLGHLKQHLAIHTSGKTVQCNVCSSAFWRKIDLERHVERKHKLE